MNWPMDEDIVKPGEEKEEDMNAHVEHRLMETWPANCVEGECEHIDEDGQPEDLSECPSSQTEVCVTCMTERYQSSDEEDWDGVVTVWPCSSKADVVLEDGPASWFKPPAGSISQ